MALDILDLKKVADNGLLSKIQIGGKVYEIKDLIARENIEGLADLLDALSAKVGNVAEGQNLADIIKNIQENAYDDTELRGLIEALQEADKLLANKEQVATDITAAVKAEADIARAAEKANADEIARVDAALKLAVDNNVEGMDSIKELANWVNTHGADAENMTKAISKNAEDIAAMDEAYKAADTAIDGRLDAIETMLGDGEGSVADQIADAVDEAVAEANGYTDTREAEITKAYAAADKAITDSLKALAHKDSASGTVAGQTISGVKATGTSAGSINVALEQSEHAMNSTGKFTPVGTVAGTVMTAGSVAVTAKYDAADAVLSKGDYTPAGTVTSDFGHATADAELVMSKHAPEGSVSVALSGNTFNAITGVGTQASFVEGAYHAATMDKTDVTANYATEGLVGSVEDECLTFTAAGIAAITATKVNAFDGGSKDADQFVANSLPTMASQTVGVQSASFTGVEHDCVTGVKYDKASMSALTFAGTKAEGALVTGVSYQKADIGSATFTGAEVDIAATFAGTEGDVAVAGLCHDYAVKTAEFVPAAIEVAVGDIVVASKDVTVQ